MKKIFLIIIIVISSIKVYAQDGKIISKEQFSLSSDQLFKYYNARTPKIDSSYLDTHKEVMQNVSFYRIAYISDGLKVKGYMAIPNTTKKLPCLIFNRGGGGEFGKINDVTFVAANIGEIAAAGYIVVASQYRGNDGGEGKDEYGGHEVNDVLNMIPLLKNIAKADTDRIGVYGHSRGGMMTYLALTKTKQFKAAIVSSGPTDFLKEAESRPDIDNWLPNYIDNYEKNRELEMRKRSAIYFADSMTKNTPTLILQGGGDDRVEPETIFPFVHKLYKIKFPFRFIFYEGGNHILLEHRENALNQMINWLHKYVRDEEQWPSLEPHGKF